MQNNLRRRAFVEYITQTRNDKELGRPIDFGEVRDACNTFANIIEEKRESIYSYYDGYATRPAIDDEIFRSLDLLSSISENRKYFQFLVGDVFSILPRNQPLYSLVYQGVIPSLMSERTLLRPPQAARRIINDLTRNLQVYKYFPNLEISYTTYSEFTGLANTRCADAMLFAGTWETAQKVRARIPNNCLMTVSGAGHNPVIVWGDAPLELSLRSVVNLCLLNQGQDCAAPNIVFVYEEIIDEFADLLEKEIKSIMVGYCSQKSFEHIIGSNTDAAQVKYVSRLLRSYDRPQIFGGEVDFDTNTIFPAIIYASKKDSICYEELFAPIVKLRRFRNSSDLERYFSNTLYQRRAMYLTHWGKPKPDFSIDPSLHPTETILCNTDLHSKERGVLPYGGYGVEASAVCCGQSTLATPILPQREIFTFLVEPHLREEARKMQNCGESPETGSVKSQRIEKLTRLREAGRNPYPLNYQVTAKADALQKKYSDLLNDGRTDDVVSIAGRIVASRNSGMFKDILDGTGKIQVFSHKNNTPQQYLDLDEFLDIGDFIGVRGKVRRTRAGELTVDAEYVEVLSKSLRPLPDKFHGVTDIELRRRDRSLDLIANAESRAVFRDRSKIIAFIRNLMFSRGFLEVETPVLHEIYGGATADPFETHFNAVHRNMYLRIALELHLKRTLIGGVSDNIFEIGRVFRNEGVSTRHNPEFTMMEAYAAYASVEDLMKLVEEVFGQACIHLHESTSLTYGDVTLDFSGPFKRLPMSEAVLSATGVDFLSITSASDAATKARELGVEIEEGAVWGECLEAVFGEFVEPDLIQPTHVTHFPKDISPLAKASESDRRISERFETYVNGWEIANAFAELNDPIEQRTRLVEQMNLAHKRGEISREVDEDFLAAIELGMPPTGGLGIGIDRLVMLLTNSKSIRDVVLFPALRAK